MPYRKPLLEDSCFGRHLKRCPIGNLFWTGTRLLRARVWARAFHCEAGRLGPPFNNMPYWKPLLEENEVPSGARFWTENPCPKRAHSWRETMFQAVRPMTGRAAKPGLGAGSGPPLTHASFGGGTRLHRDGGSGERN